MHVHEALVGGVFAIQRFGSGPSRELGDGLAACDGMS